MKILVIFLLTVMTFSNGLGQDTFTVKITIDARILNNPKSFGIRGNTSPLSWETTFMLQDDDKDGIYESEVVFTSPNQRIIEYKLVYGDKKVIYELEGQNRILILDNSTIEKKMTWNLQDEFDTKKLPLLSSEKLLSDYQIFKTALNEVHPGLYRYKTKKEIDSLLSYYETVFSQPMTFEQAFLNFTRITSFIQCGHTFPSFYNQNGFIKQVVLNRKDKLPFTFRIINKRMFITESVSQLTEIPLGSEVLSINGVKSSIFLPYIANLVKADGANDNKRFADLNTFGLGEFEMFDAYFPLLYPPKEGRYEIEIQIPNALQNETITVEAIDRNERKNRLKQKYPNLPLNPSELWKLEFWENRTAYLQLGTFDGFQLNFEWKSFLKDAFSKIKKNNIENLVIDIRWNEGGQDDILLYLGKNLDKSKLNIPQRQDLVRYDKISETIKPFLFTWDKTFYDLTEKVKPVNSEYFTFTQPSNVDISPNANAFKGNIYLLVNAANSSATFYFAEIAKENKLATLVGETTGDNQQGLNAGTMFFLRLPNSQIEIDIPIIGTFSNDKPFGGIVPDFIVKETVDDILNRRDPVKEKVKQLIEKR